MASLRIGSLLVTFHEPSPPGSDTQTETFG